MTTPENSLVPAPVSSNPDTLVLPMVVPSTPAPTPPPSTTPAGWYADPDGKPVQRYWDGNRWTEHTAPQAHAPAVAAPPAPIIINNSSSASAAATVVVAGRKPVNHLLHFILTILTGGLWLFVWIIVAIARR
ncbi:DUF2510 domain-containing protein [Prescottella defluvii]|nr:DUF2510 domain-containing protein [Prescottella defluvii]